MLGILLFQVRMDSINFILTRGIRDVLVPPCSQGWAICRIKARTMVDDNYGVCLEIAVSFSLNEPISACAVCAVILSIC